MSTNENTPDDLQARLAAHPVAKHIDLMLQEARAEGERAATARIVKLLRDEGDMLDRKANEAEGLHDKPWWIAELRAEAAYHRKAASRIEGEFAP